ncbi:kin of IRRE-like protein 1 [Watersipora subatra]|uniref:kin of IRRE-like protein 1 n=1 Tax=Watersipora subatra TaxID=2589382 RepID=UPI00355B063F
MSRLTLFLYFTICTSSLCDGQLRFIRFITEPVVEVQLTGSVTISAELENLPVGYDDLDIGWSVFPGYYVGVIGNRVSDALRSIFDWSIDTQANLVDLTIKSANLPMNGSVSLLINYAGREAIQHSSITLIILVPPSTLEMHLTEGNTVEAGKTYNISCTAGGSNPGVDIQWLHNSEEVAGITRNIRDLASNSFTTISHLAISPLSSNDGDEYQCVVTAKSMPNAQTKSLTINVLYAPTVIMSVSPNKDHQISGTKVVHTCTATSNPADVTWQWFIGDEILPDGTSSSYTHDSIDAGLNGQKIKCVASNSQGSGDKEKDLNIYYAPKFEKVPSNVEVDMGNPVSLECKAVGNPKPVITWSKMISDSSYRIVANNEVFELQSMRESDFGKYRCSAAVGEEYFDTLKVEIHLFKNDVPTVLNSGAVTYSQNEDAVLTSEAICIPSPTEIVWRKGKDGEVIDLSNPRYSVVSEQNLDRVVNRLEIKDLASTDYDTYNCTVRNARGSATAIFTLQQKNDFQWKWVLGVTAVLVVVAIIITIVVCSCRRKKAKTSSAGSLSVTSHTTDNSIRKPTEGMDHVELSSLPEYGMRPIDVWRNDEEPNSHILDTADFSHDQKPELYGSYPRNTHSTFTSAYPVGNYGSYRVQHPHTSNTPVPAYSTLPLRPTQMHPDAYSRAPYIGNDDLFPPPPLPEVHEERLGTNV